MRVERRRSTAVVLALFALVTCAAITAIVLLLLDINHQGAGTTMGLGNPEYWPHLAGLVSASAVTLVLLATEPHHPATGWFAVMSIGSQALVVGQLYGHCGAVLRPTSLVGARSIAVLSAPAFIFPTLALGRIAFLTPDGRFTSVRARKVAATGLVGAPVWYVATIIDRHATVGPLRAIDNPFAVPALASLSLAAQMCGAILVNGSVVLAAWNLRNRYRVAVEEERRQLLWIVFASYLGVLLAIAAPIAVLFGHDGVLLVVGGLLLTVMPISVLLCIRRFHLFGIERLISRALSYAILSGLLVGTFAATTVGVGAVVGDRSVGERIATAAGTLAAAAVARPLLRRVRERLDRHFNRRQYDARTTVQGWLETQGPRASVEQILRDALTSSTVNVRYQVENNTVVSGLGIVATPTDTALTVRRDGNVIGYIDHGSDVDRPTLEALTVMVSTELENERLRSELNLQLIELRESRQRIVEAQQAERRTIERNLHDGAQQRLVATTLWLRTLVVRHPEAVTAAGIEQAIGEINEAMKELRRLAGGLHPTLLVESGLAAAIGDLASRTPIATDVDICEGRFAPDVEAAAWFATCEAVANSLKHADPRSLTIRGARCGDHLVVSVADDGRGGVDDRTGLQAIRDRIETVGGRLHIESIAETGTTVTVELPCES